MSSKELLNSFEINKVSSHYALLIRVLDKTVDEIEMHPVVHVFDKDKKLITVCNQDNRYVLKNTIRLLEQSITNDNHEEEEDDIKYEMLVIKFDDLPKHVDSILLSLSVFMEDEETYITLNNIKDLIVEVTTHPSNEIVNSYKYSPANLCQIIIDKLKAEDERKKAEEAARKLEEKNEKKLLHVLLKILILI